MQTTVAQRCQLQPAFVIFWLYQHRQWFRSYKSFQFLLSTQLSNNGRKDSIYPFDGWFYKKRGYQSSRSIIIPLKASNTQSPKYREIRDGQGSVWLSPKVSYLFRHLIEINALSHISPVKFAYITTSASSYPGMSSILPCVKVWTAEASLYLAHLFLLKDEHEKVSVELIHQPPSANKWSHFNKRER